MVWAVKHFCWYLYGPHCDVHTDHSALKALLNTPTHRENWPAGEWLFRNWTRLSFTVQGSITRMPMLSRAPVPPNPKPTIEEGEPFGIIATLSAEDSVPQVGLSSLQLQDLDLVEIISYLQTGTFLRTTNEPGSWCYLNPSTSRRCPVLSWIWQESLSNPSDKLS